MAASTAYLTLSLLYHPPPWYVIFNLSELCLHNYQLQQDKSYKLQLNRYTLNQCYISYVYIYFRPLLEYANIVFDNCTGHDKSQLENSQYKALLLITGAKQGTSYERLIEETGFQTLNNRRTMQKLLRFHKLVHTKDPVYLSKLLPNILGNERATRALNTHTFTRIKTNTIYFSHSFLPDCVRLCNLLNKEIRSIQNYEIFKIKLSQIYQLPPKPPPHFMIGKRHNQLNHTLIRLNFSSLNFHLYQRQCNNSPNCSCGDTLETPHHYFFYVHSLPNNEIFFFSKDKNIIPDQQHFTTRLLLFGFELLDSCNNRFIFNTCMNILKKLDDRYIVLVTITMFYVYRRSFVLALVLLGNPNKYK